MNKERRWVESSIYNVGRVVWTNYNILWTTNFPIIFQMMINEIL